MDNSSKLENNAGYPTVPSEKVNEQQPPSYFSAEVQGHPSHPEQPTIGFVVPVHPTAATTTTTIIDTQPIHTQVIVTTVPLSNVPCRIRCPYCQADVRTSVHYEPGAMTHISALLCCLFGCYICCCIPYCVDGCMDACHTCPNCQRNIGVAKPM